MRVTHLRRTLKAAIAATASLGLLAASPAGACTSLVIPTTDGSRVYARTMEFAIEIDSQALLLPRHFAMHGSAAGGKPGKAWTTKYAAVGLNGFGQTTLLDGMNEKGLVGGLLYFPGFAGYVAPDKADPAKSLAPWELLSWALTSFATVKEIREALTDIQIVSLLPPVAFKTVPPLHYTFHDETGASIVIEPVNGVLKVYDNPFGVMTNSPPFDWHVTNLRNYIKMSPTNAPPLHIAGQTVTPLGAGSGLLGMPGDPTPPSRFIRAMGYVMSTKPVSSGIESVLLAEHVINNFDIPKGWIRETAADSTLEYTQWSSIADIKSRKYYVKTYTNPTLQVLDLKSMNLNAKTPLFAPLARTSAPVSITPK